jgi:pyruvate formate lyase activating enzyme
MNCLFCQNWRFRESTPQGETISARELAGVANERTFCVCTFGGDPASQMAHALATSRILATPGVRICWETNGTMDPRLLERAVQLALDSGRCIKFDLKAFDKGVQNVRVRNRLLLI